MSNTSLKKLLVTYNDSFPGHRRQMTIEGGPEDETECWKKVQRRPPKQTAKLLETMNKPDQVIQSRRTNATGTTNAMGSII